MNHKQQVIILSAELDNRVYVTNKQATDRMNDLLNRANITFNIGQGSYKGSKEVSFICLPKNQLEIDTLKHLAFNLFNQESILHQDSNGQAYLVYSDDTEVTLGKLRQLPIDQAEKLEAYTILNNKAYAVM